MLRNTQVASWRCTPPPCPKSASTRGPCWGAGMHSRTAILCAPLAGMSSDSPIGAEQPMDFTVLSEVLERHDGTA